MSDWGAVNDRVKGLEAGLELEMPGSNGTNDALIMEAVKNGTLKEEVLDQAVERILNIIYKYADHRTPQEFTMEKDTDRNAVMTVSMGQIYENDDKNKPINTPASDIILTNFSLEKITE